MMAHQASIPPASWVARRMRANSGTPVSEKPLNPPIVVSEPTMPASVTKKSVPLWIQPGWVCIRMRWPLAGTMSMITLAVARA